VKPTKSEASGNANQELSTLMETLRTTGQRLEELTVGQVDTVVDSDGRTLLLRGTQEQLKQSENARQAAILNALPAHIALLDAKGIIISVNDEWRRFGIANMMQGSGSGIGHSYLDVCDRALGDGSSEAHLAAEGIRSVLGGEKKNFSIEYGCHSLTEQRWFQLMVTPLREDRQVGAVAMHTNITERIQMEQSVQANKKQLRDLIDGLGPAMFVGLLTPEGILIEANRSALASAGLEIKDVLGKPFDRTYWWSHSPKVQQQLGEAIARAALGEASRYDVQVRAAEGQLIDVDFSLQPARDESGKVVYLVPSASVITERKRIEDALRASDQKFRQLAANITDAFWIRSPDMQQVQYISPAFEQIWGRSVESLYANPSQWSDFIFPEDRARVLSAFKTLTGNVASIDIEYRILRPSGEFRWVRVRGFQVRDSEDNLIAHSGIVTDITERKQAEMALQESEGRYRALVEWSPESIVLTRCEKILFLNPAASRMVGANSGQDLIGKSILDIVHPDFRQIVQERLRRNNAQGGIYPLIEEKLIKLDGTVIDVEVRGRSIVYDDEPATFSSLRDITEHKRATEALRASVQEFRTLAEAMPQMVWITKPDGMTIYFNQRWMDYTGLTLEKSLGSGWNKPFHPEDQQRAWAAWQRATSAMTGLYLLECRLRRADGVYRWWLIRGVPLQDNTGKVLKWFGTCTDIHDLKIVEEALFVEKETAQVRLNSIGDAVVCTDMSGKINFLNSVAEKITGWSFEQAAGRAISEVLRIKCATGGEITSNPIEEAVGQDKTAHLPSNCIFIRRDDIEIPVEGSIAPIRGHEGQVTGMIIVVRDVSVARAMSNQMAHLAEHDSLTSLPNRLLLNDRVNQAIALAPRHKKQIALLFLDLDGFKHINDSLGHSIGDKLLQSTGKRLVDCVRATDTVSRQGGDEFVVLLSEVEHPEDVAITARRMLKAVAELQSIDQHDLHITTSIGLSVYPDDGLDAETLIKNADTAMYQAKENGRQSYQFFKPAMNARAVERQSIEESLRRALERQEFVLHYQPKVNLKTGKIVGAEALLRWTHPTRGSVSPAQFIPVAEDCGLILPISQWVLHEACKQTRAWADAGLPAMTMAVNISAMEFRQDRFLDDIFVLLNETGLDPRFLELEITESILMTRAESAASVLQTLRTCGVKIAVDDFGTGYSSLSYLRKFPIDALKIDQSFVRQITMTPEDTTIVSAIISIGQSMKLRVIAEGVETLKELEFLQVHKCDEGQGYYFSRPVPAQQFVKLLETGVPEAIPH
jgi:diguanylate cyclase (GGDEF)-like protein/PAS domain S-box-containing protein